MKRFLAKSVFVVAIVGCAPSARVDHPEVKTAVPATAQEHDQASAADYVGAEDGSAWFSGANKTIRFCVQTAPGFGWSQSELETKVSATLRQWRDYMKAKQVSSYELPETLTVIPKCDGSQDIRFMFGVDDAVVNANRSRFSHPVAMAIRTSVEQDGSWAKGVIWVAANGTFQIEDNSRFPDWSLDQNLNAILLHEVGHVCGVGHVDGTVMQKDIAKNLNKTVQESRANLNSIDGFQALLICERCYQVRNGILGTKMQTTTSVGSAVSVANEDTTRDNFVRLVGRAAVGEIRASVDGSLDKSLRLSVRDDQGSYSFDIALGDSTIEDVGAPIFKKFTSAVAAANIVGTTTHTSRSQFAMLTTERGEKLMLSIEMNKGLFISKTKGVGTAAKFAILFQEASTSKILFNERI